MKKDKIYNCYKKYILHNATLKYPEIRKRKFSLEYYLNNFIHVLNDVTKWESLKLINKYENEYHWKAIYNEYNKWSNDDIFHDAYIDFLKNNYFKISKVRKNKKINIFVDVTKITNKHGSEKIGLNGEYKKKNVTCLSIACDENKIPLGLSYLNTNLNKTKTGKHTFQHDIKGLQPTLDSIPINIKPYIAVNLIGDKGYISSNKFKLFERDVRIITPKRKNQKKKNTKKEHKLLAKRHKIENFFVTIKRKDRVMLRKERKIGSYMSFVYITLIEYLFKTSKDMDVTIYS